MIKKIVTFIVLFVLIISVSQTITLGSYLFGNKTQGNYISREIILSFLPYLYTYGFGSKINYDGIYNASDKVDIVISNHINTIDFVIYLSLIRLFDTKPIYLIFKKSVVFVPAFGFILGTGPDVKMNKKFEDDIDNITNFISKIKNGVLIFMPEGTRYTPDKFIAAQKYSRDNDLPVFNNTLFPKMRGLFTISNILKQNGRLGNIIDFTIQIENVKNNITYMDKLMTQKLGNTFSIMNTYNIPNIVLDNYNTFKNWFLSTIWIKKDKILDTIHETNKYNYKELIPTMKGYELFIIVICLTLFIYLTINTKGLYLPVSLIITYSIVYMIYRKLKKQI